MRLAVDGTPSPAEQPFRSWPHDRLEPLAYVAGLGDEELRALLEREVERRRRGPRSEKSGGVDPAARA
jgi:hypothetical protein